jgi:hypothetical protein
MALTAYDSINYIPDISFIAGTDQLWTYKVFLEDGVTGANISQGTAKVIIFPYGFPDAPVLEINGTATDLITFEIFIPAASTLALSGKYIQQPILTDLSGNICRVGQGTIIIFPASPLGVVV